MKKIFTLIAAALFAGSASATSYSVGEPSNNVTDKTGNVWYDSETKTITFHETWSYRPGWWLAWNNTDQANTGNDYSAYNTFVLELESAVDYTIQVVVEDVNGKSVNGSGNGAKISVDLTSNADFDLKHVNQVYLQSNTAGVTAVFKDAYFTDGADEDLNLYWSGEHTVSWDNTIKASASQIKKSGAKVGDIIQITFSGYTDGHQMLIYSDWNVFIPGTFKCTFTEGVTTYTFGVTTNNLAVMQEKGFFVSGSGVTVTEVRLIPSESEGDADLILFGGNFNQFNDATNWIEVYQTGLSTDGYNYLAVEVSETPGWIKVLNKNWKTIETTPVIAGNTYYFPLTDIGTNITQFILQGTTFKVNSMKLTTEASGINNAVAAKAVNDGKMYNAAGQQVSASFKGLVIKNGKKYIAK